MRLIDKDALIKQAQSDGAYDYVSAHEVADAAEIDAVPVVRGEWEINGYCSECRGRAPFWSMASTYYKSNYCPNCGAKMDLEV